MKLVAKRPDRAYVCENLWLPKTYINVEGTKAALTFTYVDEREVKAFCLWQEARDHLIVPREFWDRNQVAPFEMVDCRPPSYPRVSFNSSVVLDAKNPHGTIQRDALDAMLTAQGGILQLACGMGKSVIALELIAQLQVPALIVVDNTQLLRQWRDEIKKFLHVSEENIGLVGDGEFDWQKPIVLATYQTLAHKAATFPLEVRRWFGVTIWDECFPAGTLVDGKPIEDFQVGDTVRSFNHKTGRLTEGIVASTKTSNTPLLLRVRLEDGRTFICTPGHPFFTRQGYVEAQNLHPHDAVATLSKEGELLAFVGVKSVEILEPGRNGTFGGLCAGGLVHNLHVEPHHNYFVDDTLVHNSHHIAAPTFARSADLFFGRRYGLTATPNRVDGMNVVYEMHLGPLLYKNLTHSLKPEIYFMWTGMKVDTADMQVRPFVCDKNGELHLGKLAGYFGRWDTRLNFIINEVRKAVAANRKILVLSNSVDELINLYAMWIGYPKYTDVPMPAPTEVGHNHPPIEMEEKKIKRTWARIHAVEAELKQLTHPAKIAEKKKILELLRNDIYSHQSWDAVQKLLRERQRAYIKDLLKQPSNAGLLTFKVGVDERQRMLKTKDVIFSIMKYGKEGLDKPNLDTVLLCEPISQRNILQQVMGRALRELAGKGQPIFIVLEDDVGPMIGMCQALRKHLREWSVEEGGPYTYNLVGYPHRKHGHRNIAL
jgi:superfamily II DNA or RNA helicase/uncharacterized protein YwbE